MNNDSCLNICNDDTHLYLETYLLTGNEVLGTNFHEQECKLTVTVCMILVVFPLFHSGKSQCLEHVVEDKKNSNMLAFCQDVVRHPRCCVRVNYDTLHGLK